MTKQELKNQIIQFYKKYYKLHNEAPSLKKVFEHFKKHKLYYAKFYDIFPRGQAEACKLAEIPVPEERLKQTRKARRTAKKKRVKEPPETKATLIHDVKQSYEIQHEVQQREEQRRKEAVEKITEVVAILLQDSNEAISGPLRDSLEKNILPIIFKKYGVNATVPEILATLKEYKKAEDEGWCPEFTIEWGLLSEKDRKTFREICNTSTGGSIGLPDYLSTLKSEIGALISQKNRLLEEANEIKQEKRKLDWDYSALTTRYNNLKKNYEEREKQLGERYNKMWREYAAAYEKAKHEMNLKIGKELKEHDRLIMKNRELRDMINRTKRLNSKPGHGGIDFKKMWESLGFSASEQNKKTVA